jgi:phage terminase large subunit-like protein
MGGAEVEPFTLAHFRAWAGELILDSGEHWQLEPFQEDFVGDMLGSTMSRREDRTGLKELWLVVPEGNGKSTLMAGLGLYHAEFTPDAMVPVAASSRDQAKIIYRQAKGFVRRTPRLADAFRPYDGYRRITYTATDSQIEIFAADDRTGDGIIPTLALVDELHRHRTLDLYETWTGKLDKRGAQILVISTAGDPSGEFELTRERLRQAASVTSRVGGRVRGLSDEFVIHDWSVPEDGDPEDLALVKAANPLSSITLESLRKKRESPTMSLGHWRRFVCNLPTRSDAAAVTEAEWAAALVEDEIPEGDAIWLGVDLAFKYDTTAFVPLWWRDDDYRLLGPATILTPPRNGDSLDAHSVEAAFRRIHERNPVHTAVVDRSKAEQFCQWLEDEFGCEVVERAQVNKFMVVDHELFMEALREGWLKHTGDAGLTRHVLNAISYMLPGGDSKFERPAQSRTVSTEEQDRRVIDALTAASQVHSEATVMARGGDAWASAW